MGFINDARQEWTGHNLGESERSATEELEGHQSAKSRDPCRLWKHVICVAQEQGRGLRKDPGLHRGPCSYSKHRSLEFTVK